jgi:hypothetical protein
LIYINAAVAHADIVGSAFATSKGERVKTFMLLTAGGPLVILTSYDSVTAPDLLRKFKAKGITKFVAYEIPLSLAQERYGGHFFVAEHELDETDALRVLDHNGARAFSLFKFRELGPPETYEAPTD